MKSQFHIREKIFPSNNSLQFSITRINNAELSQTIMSKNIQAFLNIIRGKAHERTFYHVRSDINFFITIFFCLIKNAYDIFIC